MSDERDLKSHQIMELSRELERVRTAPLGDFTDAQAVKLAEIEAASDAEESVRERVARALADTLDHRDKDWYFESYGDLYRRYADAAIAVMRGDS